MKRPHRPQTQEPHFKRPLGRAATLAVVATMLLGVAIELSGCKASKEVDEDPPMNPDLPALRIGTAATMPPVVFRTNEDLVGIEPDCAKALGEALGRRVEFVPVWWPNLIAELNEGRIDIIMAGMSITEQRMRQVAFCDSYLTVGQAAMIRGKDAEKLGTIDAIRATEQRVGVERATVGESFVLRNMPEAQLRVFPTLEAALDALRDGRVEVVIHDSLAVQWAAQQSTAQDGDIAGTWQTDTVSPDKLLVVPGLLSEERLAWAVRKDDATLREQVDVVLARWKENGRLDEILDRWLAAKPAAESAK